MVLKSYKHRGNMLYNLCLDVLFDCVIDKNVIGFRVDVIGC